MAYRVVTSTFAKTDRVDIAKYLAQYSVNAPKKFRNELKKYIDILGKTPYIFSIYHANPEYHHVVIYSNYTMFYTVNDTDQVVSIYRILHGAQDIANIL